VHLARRQSDAAALGTARNSRAQARSSAVSGSYCALPCGSYSPVVHTPLWFVLPCGSYSHA
jgi:hypothetical protein